VTRVYDDAGNVIETREHNGDFKRVVKFSLASSRGSAKTIFRDSAIIESLRRALQKCTR
jgi:hypothetical protein